MSTTASLAAMLVSTRFEDLPKSTVEAVRRSVLDTIGCVVAGSRLAQPARLSRTLAEIGGVPAATVIGHRSRLPAPWAAMANATAGRALDVDDVYEPGQVHASVAVVPAALAVAESLPRVVSGRDFVTAVATAIDLLARLSVAPARDANSTGLSYTYHFGVFAAAAVTARLHGADERTMTDALGLALGMAGGTRQPNLEGAPSVALQQGWTAHAGVMAGLLAAHGHGGPREVFEGRAGYFAVYHRGDYSPARLLAELGERFAVEDLTTKFYPACKYAHGAIAALLALREEGGVTPETLRRLTVRVPRATYAAVCEPEAAKRAPTTVSEAQFSLPYLAAVALVRGRVSPADLDPAGLADERVAAWCRRVELEPDDSLRTAPDALSTAAVTVELADGRRMSRTVTHVPGEPSEPADFRRVADKARGLVTSVPADDGVDFDRLVDRIAALEELSDVRDLALAVAG